MLTKPISELAKKVSSGLTPLRSNLVFWEDGSIPWLKTEQLGEKYIYDTTEKITEEALKKTSIKLHPPNTLSIAMYGEGKTRGNLSIIRTKMATNQACCNIELDAQIADYEYVYYFLKTQYQELRNLSSGVRKNLNSNDIKNFNIRLPAEVLDQQKISKVLSTLDAKIELNKHINAELEAMVKTLYDYWFVQFDFPDQNDKPYKSSGGKMVYNDNLKREIPEGWDNAELGGVCDLYQPKTISEKEMSDNGDFLVYGANGVVGRHTEYNHESSVVTITCRGNSCGTINITRPYSWITGNAMVVKPKSELLCVAYLLNALRWADISTVITGSAQPQITRTNLAPLKIVSPEPSVLEKFKDIVGSSVRRKTKNIEEMEQLTKLRDWLLPMLMNGQLTVE